MENKNLTPREAESIVKFIIGALFVTHTFPIIFGLVSNSTFWVGYRLGWTVNFWILVGCFFVGLLMYAFDSDIYFTRDYERFKERNKNK